MKRETNKPTIVKEKEWGSGTWTHLKLFQGFICSITQIVPHSGKVHWMLYYIMIIRKLHSYQSTNLRTPLQVIPEYNLQQFHKELANLLRIDWFCIHAINILPAQNEIKAFQGPDKPLKKQSTKHSPFTHNSKHTSEACPRSTPVSSFQAMEA